MECPVGCVGGQHGEPSDESARRLTSSEQADDLALARALAAEDAKASERPRRSALPSLELQMQRVLILLQCTLLMCFDAQNCCDRCLDGQGHQGRRAGSAGVDPHCLSKHAMCTHAESLKAVCNQVAAAIAASMIVTEPVDLVPGGSAYPVKRPRGRTPFGKEWDSMRGCWVDIKTGALRKPTLNF